MLLFADANGTVVPLSPFWMAVTAIIVAGTPIVVVVANIAQTWFQEWQAKYRAKKLEEALHKKQQEEEASRSKTESAAESAASTAKQSLSVNNENAGKLDRVYSAVNGDGIGGAMKRMAERQTIHEQRLEKMEGKIDGITEAMQSNMRAIRSLTDAKQAASEKA